MALHCAKKTDGLLVFFAIFNILNVVLFIYGYLNWSFENIILIFSAGICNLLFALWMMIRSHREKYQYDYGPDKCAAASYYVRTVFYGALGIAFFIAMSSGLFVWIAHTGISSHVSPESVVACRDALISPDNSATEFSLRYALNYASCSLGAGHMFTLVGMTQSDFLVSLLQHLFQVLTVHSVYLQYLLYLCAGLILLPFVWLFYRLIHLLNSLRMDVRP